MSVRSASYVGGQAMRWAVVVLVAVVLVFLDLAALHDIFVGESDLRAEYATLACSSLVLAGMLAGVLSRAADRRRPAPGEGQRD